MRGPVLGIVLLAAGHAAAAQLPEPRVRIGISASQMRVHTTLPGFTDMLDATALGGEISLAFGAFRVRGAYRQADLAPANPANPARDAAEGELLIGFTPVPWLTIYTGPHRRSYSSDVFGTQRWSMWEFRVRSDVPLVSQYLRAYAELWPAVAASVNVPEAWSSAFGGDGGLELVLPTVPVSLRAGYRIEVHRLAGGRRETADGISVTLSVGLLGPR